MLQFRRDPLLSQEEAVRIHQLAKGILNQIGLEIRHEGTLKTLIARGFDIREDRVYLAPAFVDAYVEMMRTWLAPADASPSGGDEIPTQNVPSVRPLTLSVSSYALNVHDIESDTVVPMTTPRLIEMTKLVDTLADEGVVNAPPGIPVDVPPDLQPLAQYRIAANYARQGVSPVDPTSACTVVALFDMADVMGRPLTRLPIYVPTPLRFGGESLDVVLTMVDRLSDIHVSSMPSTGASAPLQPFGALALSAAEVMGGAIVAHEITDKPVFFRVHIFPFDLRAGAMVFGSPENALFQILSHDLNRFYGWPPSPAPNNVHVMTKRPDGQSAAEKAAIMAMGASLGARHFSCAGTLSLDEVFSPEQLMLDCEIRDWVARWVRGISIVEDQVGDWLEEIREGIQQGFMALDSTLDHYREQTWYPARFERRAIGPWLEEDQPHLATRLRAEVRERIAGHAYRLDETRRNALDAIYAAAERATSRS